MASATSLSAPPAPAPQPKELSPRSMTFGEYIELERKSEVKHHFYFGRRIPMAGATYEHNMVSSNLFVALASALKGTGCRTLRSDMKVFISENVGYYPDLVVHCEAPLIAFGEALQNPFLIAEILSSSTEAFDRGKKFQQYRGIASLRHVLFLEQSHCLVEHYERHDASTWVLHGAYDQMVQGITLAVGDTVVTLSVADIYQSVVFPEPKNETDPEKSS